VDADVYVGLRADYTLEIGIVLASLQECRYVDKPVRNRHYPSLC